LTCPDCGSDLGPIDDSAEAVHRLLCPECGGTFRAVRRQLGLPSNHAPVVDGIGHVFRVAALRVVPIVYRIGLWVGSVALFALGGFVPVTRRWLAGPDEGLKGVVEALGGVWVATESRDPDNDFGPVLRRLDAPRLFGEVAEVARRLGVRPPEEIRLAFLPCCGVLAWRSSRALLLGMPLLHVLTVAEIRAVLAHELAHLASGDATWSAGSVRFVEALGAALDARARSWWSPLQAWARVCRHVADTLVGPIRRGQETRADRASALLAGGAVAASALVKVALVQPLFREVLAYHDTRQPGENLYASFRAFWGRLPAPLIEEMRLRLVAIDPGASDSPHPPLPDRIALVQQYADSAVFAKSGEAAWTLLGDPEWLEQMLDERLFGLSALEPTVFHKAGT
jgi:Zn-dependent protease with chaperone function